MPSQAVLVNDPNSVPPDALLHQCFCEARSAWPGIDVSPQRFLPALSLVLKRNGTADSTVSALPRVHASDLYLACACADGNLAAILSIETHYFPDLERALSRLGLAPYSIAELIQQLRCRLFVGSHGKPPQIASYTGYGELRSWLRSVAVRDGLRLLKNEHRLFPTNDVEALAGVTPDDPELLLMRELYSEAFRMAFSMAMSSLSARERNLLRQHFLDRLSIDKLAILYRVHRATAARWLARSQAALMERTRAELRERLGVGNEDLDSIMRLLLSRIGQSVRRLLS